MTDDPENGAQDGKVPAEPPLTSGVQPLALAEAHGSADRPPLGIVCAVLAMFSIAVMDGLAKHLVASYPVGQVSFARQLLALLPLSLLIWHEGGLKALRTRHPGLHILRGLLLTGGSVSFFLGLRYLGLAEATVLAFAAPLFITAFALPLLGEPTGLHRWAAVVVGFLGVLIVVRPGAEAMNMAALLPLFAALCYALAMIATRRLSRSDGVAAIAIFGNLTTIAATSGLLVLGWKTPALADLWAFVIMGLLGGSITFFTILAYRLAPAAVVAPFDYTALIWATAIGWLVWREIPDGFVWLGATIIIASGLYILYRETRGASR
jgi:drug/metabolite transporter (DMT)-like permease